MKDAKLWKRILHGGLGSRSQKLADFIIKLPILVDSRPLDDSSSVAQAWSEFNWIAPPFPVFWFEGPYPSVDASGAIVESRFGAVVFYEGNTIRACMFSGCDRGVVNEGQGKFHLTDSFGPELDGRGGAKLYFDQEFGKSTQHLTGYLCNICEVLQLLGCKNVFLSARETDPKQARIATKRHGPSDTGYRYHVLTVRPPGAKSDSPGIDIGTMPRHVCRGHFAEYGPDYNKGLLFGKYAGRFFIPPHLKGRRENGIVEKDYRIACVD